MAIDTTKSWQEFTADGSTAYFTFNFNYIADRPTDIIVGTRTGENTYQAIPSDNYQLTPNPSGDGGQIRFIKRVMVGNDEVIQDDIPPAGIVVRIARKSLDTSNATWRIGLEMSEIINLFDRLFRLTQENKGRFANTIHTFATQHDVNLYELLSAQQDKILYWDNNTKTLTPTVFPYQDIVRCSGGLFFRITADPNTHKQYLEWSEDGIQSWHGIGILALQSQIDDIRATANQALSTANDASNIATSASQTSQQALTVANESSTKSQEATQTANQALAIADSVGTIFREWI